MSSVEGMLKHINRPSSPHRFQGIVDNIGISTGAAAAREDSQLTGDSRRSFATSTETHSDGKLLQNGTVKSSSHSQNSSLKNMHSTSECMVNRKQKLGLVNELQNSSAEIEENDSPTTPVTIQTPSPTHEFPEQQSSPKAVTTSTNLPDKYHRDSPELQNSQLTDIYAATSNSKLPDGEKDTTGCPTGLDSRPTVLSDISSHRTKNAHHSHSPDAPTHLRNPTQTASQLASLMDSSRLSDVVGNRTGHSRYRTKSSDDSRAQFDDLMNVSDTDTSSKSSSHPSDLGCKNSSVTKSAVPCSVTDWLENCANCQNSNPSQSKTETSSAPEVTNSSQNSKMDLTSSSETNNKADITHLSYPDWKLDRRESGHLFWRRDSSQLNGIDPSSRVKFRYDVEVCEFETRNSEAEDLAEGEEDSDDEDYESDNEFKSSLIKSSKQAFEIREEPTPLTSTRIICVILAITALIVALIYQWLKPSDPPNKTNQ